MWRLSVTDACIGSGSCVGVTPAHFLLGADNRSRPVAVEVASDEAVRDAAASCPVEAILIHDSDTGAPIEP
jgi:ferredoxin